MFLKILLYLLFVLDSQQFIAREATFYSSSVAIARFDSTLINKELVEFNSVIEASLRCLDRNWCDAFCLLPNKTAILNDLVISGGIEDTKSGQKVVCYTKRPRVIYPTPQATISSSPVDVQYPQRISANLEDGVYGFDIEECFRATVSTGKKHFLIGFSKPKVVSNVKVRTQKTGGLQNKFKRFEVRGGNSVPVGNDMSQLSLIEVFNRPMTETDLNTDLTFTADPKITAQYISIQETDVDVDFQICHLEVL